jgi:predicted NAD/FAD-dependent oxidoreductase
MAKVVIIGGGLCGLAAAWELEQRGVDYTLIEVKRRLGGALGSTAIADAHGRTWTFDHAPMFYDAADDWSFLQPLGLGAALVSVDATRVAWRDGANTLIDALAAQQQRGVNLMRMAVHSVGTVQTRGKTAYGVCLENGLLLSASALVIAVPARYAAILFRQLQPQIAYQLEQLRYDTITRLSLGYARAAAPHIPATPLPDYPITEFAHWHDSPRAPSDGVIIQVGVRHEWLPNDPRDLVGELAALFGWEAHPAAEHLHYWPEADPLRALPEHAAALRMIPHLLPPRVGLAGSDYAATPLRLSERIAAGRAAARRALGVDER